jgi:ribosomal protein L14
MENRQKLQQICNLRTFEINTLFVLRLYKGVKMDLKKTLLDVISGTGEAGETVVSASQKIVKEGTATVGDLIKVTFEIAKETGKDTTELVKDVVVGAVKATAETVGAAEEGATTVIVEAEKAAGEITEEGGEDVRQGIAKAKEVIKEPLK